MSPALRILYAEDNTLDAELTRSHFAEHVPDFEIEVVETGHQCLARLHRADCDLLLLDHRLPDMDGMDVLKTLVRAGMRLPVVLVTGVGDENLVVRALRLGAASYVPKQGDYLKSLPDLLRGVIEEHRLKQSQGLLASVSRRVLYVEHHTMDIELTLRHFAEEAPQFEIDVAHTCADALARLSRPPAYDVVLVDLRMPDQSGLDFAREARCRGLPLPPFIMLSGKGDEAAAIASLKLGAADYLAKREGYLEQLPTTIDRAIAYDRLDRLNQQLRTELAERKRAEAELATANAELERRVAERTAELLAANQELASFAHTVSHDLRGPLHAIDGWSQVVLEDCGSQLGEEGRTHLQTVRSETHRMAQLIDDLLELSRATHAPMKRTTVDLTAMAHELEAKLRAGEPERKVDFVVAPGMVADCDAGLLRAAMANLLGNAWKFTSKRPRARIEVGFGEEDGRTVYHVRDNGVGFDMRFAGKLFAPFQRLHGLAEFAGTGIGLATVQRIIHRHGGKLWATAEVDRGATFYFTLTA
jgi:signal transduction histidine kinase